MERGCGFPGFGRSRFALSERRSKLSTSEERIKRCEGCEYAEVGYTGQLMCGAVETVWSDGGGGQFGGFRKCFAVVTCPIGKEVNLEHDRGEA